MEFYVIGKLINKPKPTFLNLFLCRNDRSEKKLLTQKEILASFPQQEYIDLFYTKVDAYRYALRITDSKIGTRRGEILVPIFKVSYNGETNDLNWDEDIIQSELMRYHSKSTVRKCSIERMILTTTIKICTVSKHSITCIYGFFCAKESIGIEDDSTRSQNFITA